MDLMVGPVKCESRVRVELTMVDRILSNLVDNAIKYGASAVDRRTHLDVAPLGRWLAVTVRDHGPGLQPSLMRRLFRPFSKSAQDAAQSAPGVGLGLALSRRLARAMGGELRLQENGSVGACFTLTIPLA
jgi:signal transduction histidine kinase